MAKSKLPKMGRPLTEGEPLVHRVCGYFTRSENAALTRVAARLTREEGARVTVAEVVRRAVRAFVGGEK
jgi:hypothetical protein